MSIEPAVAGTEFDASYAPGRNFGTLPVEALCGVLDACLTYTALCDNISELGGMTEQALISAYEVALEFFGGNSQQVKQCK